MNYKKDIKGDCLLCKLPFTNENPHFSIKLHAKCYRKNYDRIKRLQKDPNFKYNVDQFEPVINKIRPYNYTTDRRNNIEKNKLENSPMLNQFKSKVNNYGGWKSYIRNIQKAELLLDSYVLCHLFEVYYPKATTFMDSYNPPTQLIKMWDWLKNYDY